MIRSSNRSHAGTLEKCRIALDKAESNPGIAEAMKRIGYGPEVLKEGKDILESALEIFDENLQIKDDQALARTNFSKFKAEMDGRFREHRKKAIIIFRKDQVIAEKLELSKKYPTKLIDWLERMRKFYTVIVERTEIQQGFQRLNFTKEEALAELDNIEKLVDLLAKKKYFKGVSQNSTEQKNKAFAKLTEWMSDFYATARMALKKEPELLEALYKSA
jgi:hypothetical protein